MAEYIYACSNGRYIIGDPGTREHAEQVVNDNYWAAKNCGDKGHQYHLVRRPLTGWWEKVND